MPCDLAAAVRNRRQWPTPAAALALPKLPTIGATVATPIGSGFAGWKLGQAPSRGSSDREPAAAGDVAILTAASMQLMPFALINTPIGAVLAVTLAGCSIAAFNERTRRRT
jgi:Na+/citrate or Na+/malate symporter